MTPERFRHCLDTFHWSGHVFAAVVGVSDRSVRYWLAGREPVPEAIGGWLGRMQARMVADPPPVRPPHTQEQP